MGEAGDLQVDSCLILAESFWLQPANYYAILKVIFGLGFVIFVHELGHFLVAKLCGVKCEKFYVGFDVPIKLFGRTIIPGTLFSFQWGETEYGIGAIPLGGYVKMLGQDDNPGNAEEQIASSLAEGETAETAFLESGLIDRSKLHPRSFLAKSVPQRMAIISAGVIFNLIFAVMFAAFAFKSGVNYEPVVLGNAIGGGPAWKHDLNGATIQEIGDRKVEGYFPFINFVESVIFNGDSQPIPVTFIPHGETSPKTVEITPEDGFRRENPDLAMFGIGPAQIPVIGELGTVDESPAGLATPAILDKDVITEVNGVKIENEIDLRQVLTRDAQKEAVFTIERTTGEGDSKKTEIVKTTVGVNPFREIGFAVAWGGIEVIKEDSPAKQAGLQIGDEILSVNGQPRGDLLTLDMRLIKMLESNEKVTLQVKRDGKEVDVDIQPVVPKLFSNVGPDKPVAVDSLGIAVRMLYTIESIKPDSPAAKAGLEVGDDLSQMNYLLSEKQLQLERYSGVKKLKMPHVKFQEGKIKTSWGEVYSGMLQAMEIGTEIELTVKRGSELKTVKLASVPSEEHFLPTRGIHLSAKQSFYQSETWSDALTNGWNQVGKDIKRVGTTLRKLVTGEISATNLGGPGTIAVAATSEATQGTSRLLLFLTFLSANLAIVNFLPIPVLDGGHMMFLAYEGLFRKPVNEKLQIILTWGGLIFILGLMLFVISMDIGRISSWM